MHDLPRQLQPRGLDAVARLIDKGVDIPNPLTLDIGPEVTPDRISGDGVTIYPGCRIYGASTVISAGVTLGAEAPVTIDDCRLGPAVDLKGGSFRKSVFLEGANMGPGAQVRDGCLLEEEANGAHCVGLKQTILFPFVTLGSLINLCDCLMAGGTSRKDHSEVGSSYIHFNFTPDGDKTTPSLFGDVPRGVMLDQQRIFLGGQGGVVGPVRLGYGTVVAAGSILRRDVPADGMLVVSGSGRSFERERVPRSYPDLARLVTNNIVYLANLVALEQWYRHVRRRFFAAQELGDLVYEGALAMLAMAKGERCTRLKAMAAKVTPTDAGRAALRERVGEVCALVEAEPPAGRRDAFLAALEAALAGAAPGAGPADLTRYTAAIQALPADVAALGVAWLQQIVDSTCARARELLRPLALTDDE
jgi:UDP-N-acetylglucosamine/UDP-N-acetylgalactosamine diphosphorylase